MSSDQVTFELIAERSVARKDQIGEIDVAIDLITTKTVGAQPRAGIALNLCIVLDRSGSMGGEKLDLAKKSCVEISESLTSADRLSVLAFNDDVIAVVNPQTPRATVKDRLLALTADGGTNLSKGWYLGLLELQTYGSPGHINRLILLSDGQATDGEKKPSVLGAESSRARDELGITTSTIGVGTDFQEDILAALSHESGGRFWFIGEARIEDIIREEFSGALSIFLERPRIAVSLPEGLEIARELNDLPKLEGSYRLRPLKGNDHFYFAMRLRLDPSKATTDDLTITATLLDGAGVVDRANAILHLGSVEEYVQSPTDPRVAMIVGKYLTAMSNEKIVAKMDVGNVGEMVEMLQQQSNLMKDLETKLAGESPVSWETASEKEAARAEVYRRRQEEELQFVRMEIAENEALIAVGELIDLLQGIGDQSQLSAILGMLSHGRKHHHQRQMRDLECHARGDMDDWSIMSLLRAAQPVIETSLASYPNLRDELRNIQDRVNEQLTRFS